MEDVDTPQLRAQLHVGALDVEEAGRLHRRRLLAILGTQPAAQQERALVLVVHAPTGTELWGTDGSAAGTVLLKDQIPASANGFDPRSPITASGVLFFSAADNTHGRELSRTDGTPGGTGLVEDITAGPASSLPSSLIDFGGSLYFTATDAGNRVGLWRSDGSAADTVRVYDFSGVGTLAGVNGTLIFPADDGNTGFEPWKRDGTAAGTVRIQDIAPGGTSSNPSAFTVAGSHLFFMADDIAHGQELWAVPLSAISAPCAGDCDGDFAVTVDELVRGVSIDLGKSLLDRCTSFDTNGNQRVTVDELVTAVNHALDGCSAS